MDNQRFFLTLRRAVLFLICAAMVFVLKGPFLSHAQKEEPETVRVGWYESSYCYTDKFGRRNGLAYEYQRKIAAYTGWDYEYVEGGWPELLQMLKDGEIDLLSDVSYTDERAEEILYPSLPMGEESYYIYIGSDDTSMTADDITTFAGKKFGVNIGSVQETMLMDWAKDNDIEIEIVQLTGQSMDEMLDMLVQGELDAFVTMNTYGGRMECTPVQKLGASEYYFAVNKDRPDLLSSLNMAMNRIMNENPYYNQEMFKEYILSVNETAFLNAPEKVWAENHGSIRIGYRDNYLPFCERDPSTGELTGALKDYLEYASDSMKNEALEFETVPYSSVEDAISALERGEIDCVFPVNMSTYECEKNHVLLSDSLMEAEAYAIVRRGQHKDFMSGSDIRCAINVGNTSFETFVMDNYPDWEVVYYDSSEDCFEAVADGAADCLLVTSYRMYQTDRIRNRYKLAMIATGKYIKYAFVVPEKDTELYSILNKTVNLIGEYAVDSALSKYAFINDRITLADYVRDNLPTVIAIISVFALVIILLANQKQKAEKKATASQELITATEFDPVTKLYNREFFYEYAGRMFKEHPEYKCDAIALNLDQFHTVNAINGWEFGDTVLKTIAEEITAYLDETDGIACRSQADRFSIFCRSTESYQGLYDRIQGRIDKLEGNVSMRLRMGVMHWQEGVDPVQLFDRARTACNMVRGGHTTKIMVFNEDMRQKELRDQRLLSDLRRALEDHEFLVYFQPKYDIQSNPPVICAAEALVRWKHPELGMVSPGDFIPLFEENCKISLLDRYVWREVARKIAYWKNKYGVVIPISVNLSRLDVFDPDLEQILDGIISDNDLDRGSLDLEVTESAYTDDADKVISVVEMLRKMGHHIEMDDFGTGYSSLSMLSSMPVDILKLDRAFIINMDKDESDARLVELILDIAKGLKVSVVAEGVETKEQLQFLKERGCEMVQGYYFSPPIPSSDFEEKYIAGMK